MRFAPVFALLAVPFCLDAQLYFVAGTPVSNGYGGLHASILFRVSGNGVQRLSEIASQEFGTGWIGFSYDQRKAVILEAQREQVHVLDLDKAAVVKTCAPPPPVQGAGRLDQWLAEIPGKGATLEMLISHSDAREDTLQEMVLDASLPCDKSFANADVYDIRYVTATGAAGFGLASSDDWINLVWLDGDGNLRRMQSGKIVDFGYRLPRELWIDPQDPVITIAANNSRTLVLTLGSEAGTRFVVLRKADTTWHVIPSQGDWYPFVRAFGDFVAVVEAREKKAIAQQRVKHRGSTVIDDDVREREQSAGRSEWRREETATGPDMAEIFATSGAIHPGRLHLYNVATEKLYTIATGQGDSEIVLVEDRTVYYRVSNRLYSAPITDGGVGTGRLLATDEAIRDAHWAFITH